MPSAILLMHCADRPGIVAAVTEFIMRHRGNILDLEQHVDSELAVFFMRVEVDLDGFDLDGETIGEVFGAELGERFAMEWRLHFSDEIPRVAIFVSRLPHCLTDLLARLDAGEWAAEVPLVVSNHGELREVVERHGIPFFEIPVEPDTKAALEQREIELLEEHGVDTIILARYMQILSTGFVERYRNRIINIHHSFLPAFPGARPYHSAFRRGVKLIGATSHYVTPELDAGPIIEQDVVRASHRDSVDDLVRKGRDLEKIVLARAVRAHLTRRTLVFDDRTVVFG